MLKGTTTIASIVLIAAVMCLALMGYTIGREQSIAKPRLVEIEKPTLVTEMQECETIVKVATTTEYITEFVYGICEEQDITPLTVEIESLKVSRQQCKDNEILLANKLEQCYQDLLK